MEKIYNLHVVFSSRLCTTSGDYGLVVTGRHSCSSPEIRCSSVCQGFHDSRSINQQVSVAKFVAAQISGEQLH